MRLCKIWQQLNNIIQIRGKSALKMICISYSHQNLFRREALLKSPWIDNQKSRLCPNHMLTSVNHRSNPCPVEEHVAVRPSITNESHRTRIAANHSLIWARRVGGDPCPPHHHSSITCMTKTQIRCPCIIRDQRLAAMISGAILARKLLSLILQTRQALASMLKRMQRLTD